VYTNELEGHILNAKWCHGQVRRGTGKGTKTFFKFSTLTVFEVMIFMTKDFFFVELDIVHANNHMLYQLSYIPSPRNFLKS
jgi:hypothetical protein